MNMEHVIENYKASNDLDKLFHYGCIDCGEELAWSGSEFGDYVAFCCDRMYEILPIKWKRIAWNKQSNHMRKD